jgi:hypothetical protein
MRPIQWTALALSLALVASGSASAQQTGVPDGNPAHCDGFFVPEDPSSPDSGPGFGPFDKYEEEDDDWLEWPYAGEVVQYYLDYLKSDGESGGIALGQGLGAAECFPNSPRGASDD